MDIQIIQQAGPKDYNKNTLSSFAAKIFNTMQTKIVLDHKAGVQAVSSPLYTIYAYKISKAVTVNNSLVPQLSTFTCREND